MHEGDLAARGVMEAPEVGKLRRPEEKSAPPAQLAAAVLGVLVVGGGSVQDSGEPMIVAKDA